MPYLQAALRCGVVAEDELLGVMTFNLGNALRGALRVPPHGRARRRATVGLE